MPVIGSNTDYFLDKYRGSNSQGNIFLGSNQISIGSNGNTKTNSLLGNFTAISPSSYPGSGSTWTNLKSGGGDLTLVNSPTYTQKLAYYPLNYFTFSTSSYATGSIAGFSPPDVLMIQAWVKTSTGSNSYGGISLGAGIIGGTNAQLGINTSGNLFARYNNTPYNYTGSTSYNVLNQWVNIAITLNTDKNIRGYVNGQFVGSFIVDPIYSGNGDLTIPHPSSSYSDFSLSQLFISNNLFDTDGFVIENNWFATKQYFEQ